MENQQRNTFSHLLSGAIGGFITVVAIASLVIAYPIDAANMIATVTQTQSPTGAITPIIPTSADVEGQTTITNVVKRVSPAVVSITLTQQVARTPSAAFDPFMRFFGIPSPFGQNQAVPVPDDDETFEVGGGTGFFVTSDGYIVTNRHVVDQSGVQLLVSTTDGKDHEARVIATDPVYDIAVLKIEGSGYPYLTFGDSSSLQVGESVIAIGNALAEFQNTVSLGIVSGLSRSITAGGSMGRSEHLSQLIQTDAAINPGNSGGPLMNIRGEVIGVNVAMAGAQNIGFALPSNTVNDVVQMILRDGKITRAFLGIRYVPVSSAVQSERSLSVDYGALVLRGENPDEPGVQPDSPADRAGIRENDVILEIDGEKIDEENALANIIRSKRVGDVVTIKILRDEKEIEVRATLVEA